MPYTIPSSVISPGSVYQPRKVPAYVSQNSRALYYARGGSISDSLLLDQSPLNSGTRRTGEEGRCYTADGTDDEVNFGNIGSAIWFSGWVRLNSDNQCLFSLSNDTNTNLIVSAGVLTAGATLTLTGIKIDDVSKTASEAGVLLNDNAWHFLSCGIGDGLGGASTADDVRFFTDGTNHGSVSGFDWRFWSTTPTAAELTEVYSGESPSRNSAALSKYALWAKCDEQSGTTAYDSSGNGLTGTLTNITAATFHATQDILSFQNQVGFNKRMYFDGVSGDVSFSNSAVILGEELSFKFATTSTAFASGIAPDPTSSTYVVHLRADGKIYFGTQLRTTESFNDGLLHHVVISGNGTTITVDGVLRATEPSGLLLLRDANTINIGCRTSSATKSFRFEGIIFDVSYGEVFQTNGYGTTDADWIDQIGSNNGTVVGSPSNIFLPRDESDPTNDVLGNPLTNTGRRPNDAALHSSNCLTADGTLYIAAAHLAGTETVVSYGGTSTPSISAGRIDFTAGTCWDLTLSDGTHYKLAEGYGTEILDASGNGNHGVLTSAVLANAWGATQNVYHSNLIDGSGKRMWFDGADDYISVEGMTATSNYFGACTISAKVYVIDPAGTFAVWALGAGCYRLLTLGGTWRVNSGVGTDTGIAVTKGYHTVEVSYNASGNAVSFVLDGTEVWTGSVTSSGETNVFYIGARDASGVGLFFNGLIWDFSLTGSAVKNFSFSGYGNTNADWIDTSGNGNDGTVVGSPEAFYIPAAPNGLDVFGNELTEKPSDATRNRAETLIDLDPDSTPEMGATQLGITVPASHAFGDAFTASDQIFSRQRTLTEDRFVVMPEAQSGSALATIQKYTQP